MWSFIVLLVLIPLALAGLSLAPWVPTQKSDLIRIQEIIASGKSKNFLEFGCGDGRVSHYIARYNPQLQVTGIELAIPMFIVAKMRSYIWPLPNLRIELGSGFKKDFKDFDSIYLFAMPESLKKRILPKFTQEAQKGTRLISYVFSMKEVPGTVKSYKREGQKTIHVLTK